MSAIISFFAHEPALYTAVRTNNYPMIMNELANDPYIDTSIEYYGKTVLGALFKYHDALDSKTGQWKPFDPNTTRMIYTLLQHGFRLNENEFYRLLSYGPVNESRVMMIAKCSNIDPDDVYDKPALFELLQKNRYGSSKIMIGAGHWHVIQHHHVVDRTITKTVMDDDTMRSMTE